MNSRYGEPLECVSKLLVAVYRATIDAPADTVFDSRVKNIFDIEWIDDRVLYKKKIVYHKMRRLDFIAYEFIMYPNTSMGDCVCCGSICDAYLSYCVRCKPLLLQIVKEAKANVKLIEDIKESKKIISEFTEKLNERHRPAKDKVSRPLVKV